MVGFVVVVVVIYVINLQRIAGKKQQQSFI